MEENFFGILAEIMLVSYYMGILLLSGGILALTYFIPGIPFRNQRLIVGIVLILVAIIIFVWENMRLG